MSQPWPNPLPPTSHSGAAPPYPAAVPPPYGAVPPYGPAAPPRSPSAQWTPERVDAVPGTDFALVQLRVEPVTSGLSIGSLLAGIVSILVSLLVLCFGLVGAEAGWGALVAGAFTLLSVVGGGGAVAVGLVARRQIRGTGQPGQMRFTGGGVAVAGIFCGATGAGLALLCLGLAVVLQLSD